MPKQVTWTVEHTDTYGGETNYSWVVRHAFDMPENASQRQIIRRAKALIGETGSPARVEYYNGDTYQIDYPGRCVRSFVVANY